MTLLWGNVMADSLVPLSFFLFFRAREEMESSSESEAEESEEPKKVTTKHDLMFKSEAKARSGFFKQARKTFPLFPVKEEKIKWDDYGEFIR